MLHVWTWTHYAKWNKLDRKRQNIVQCHLWDTYSSQIKFIETDSIMLIARGRGERGGEELLLHGCRVSVLQDEKSSGDGWGWWLHNNVEVFNATKLSKKRDMVKNIKFYVIYIYILQQVKYFHVLRILPSLGHDLGGLGWKMKMQLSLQSTWGQLWSFQFCQADARVQLPSVKIPDVQDT